MSALFVALCLFSVSGFAALLAFKSSRWAAALGVGGTVAGSGLGLFAAASVLLGGPAETLRLPAGFPGEGLGSFVLTLDALSAFFLIPVFILAALAAIYGSEYLHGNRHGPSTHAAGPFWFFYNLTVAALVLVMVAGNGLVFLLAWEVMTLASFFLVTYENEKESVRQAGWTYMVASHLGAAFLIVMFVLMGQQAGSLDFDAFARSGGLRNASLLFVLALVGFGTKAGFMPLHVWLPEAHPAAPSPVSALMSGVIIKTGIYGLVRTLTFLGAPPQWWGWLLIAIGISSGVLGVLFALAQHDLKRLLAYHSIENIGIIALGLGVGVLGLSLQAPVLAALGFAGGLLHVLNHSLFKGLLFLGAGNVAHATGTREIDHLGGLLKRMPVTAGAFLVGSIAISGLPPLNGFISEFLIYLGAFNVLADPAGSAVSVAGLGWLLAVIGALALIGGLAAACFSKAFGVVFLGEPRSEHALHVHEPGWAMCAPLVLLAAACAGIGMGAPFVLELLRPVVGQLVKMDVAAPLALAAQALFPVVSVAALLVFLLAALLALRHMLLSRWPAAETGTWDCGYARPTARMQYTASSFAQPLMQLFRVFLRTRRSGLAVKDTFPKQSAFATETPDVARENFYAPVFSRVSWGLSKLRGLQHGRVQLYVLYIVLTLMALLLWKLA